MHRHGPARGEHNRSRDRRARRHELHPLRRPSPVQLGQNFFARIYRDRVPIPTAAQKFRVARKQHRENPPHRLLPASRQQQDRPRRIITHRRNVVGREKRMPDKVHRQRGVRIAGDFERENRRQRIEITRHRKPPLGLPRPDLRRDIKQRLDRAAPFHRKPTLPQRRRQPQVHPRVIHKQHCARPVFTDPTQHVLHQRLEKRVVLQHLHNPHDRRSRQVI